MLPSSPRMPWLPRPSRLRWAGLGWNEVRVLVPSAETLSRHMLPADELGDGSEIGQRCSDLQVGEGGCRRHQAEYQQDCASNQRLHRILLGHVLHVLVLS